MLEVHNIQTPPPSEYKSRSTTTASPANQTVQGGRSSTSNSANRQEQKSHSGTLTSSHRLNSKNTNDEEFSSWVLVAQEPANGKDKTISIMSPNQIMARPLRTPNRRSTNNDAAENNDESVAELKDLFQTQDIAEWNWKEARKELSKFKQRLIVKLYPIQKPKQKHYKNFMIQPIPKEPFEFPTEQFANESHLKTFDSQQEEEIPNFDPKSFPSELGSFGSIHPQNVPDPNDFILQQLPKLEIPSISPEEIPSELASFGEINPQIVRDPNDLILQQFSVSQVPSTENLDLQELKAEMDMLETQFERRNLLLDRLSARRIVTLERMLEKKQKQVAALSRRVMELKAHENVGITSTTVEQYFPQQQNTATVKSSPVQHVDERAVGSNVARFEQPDAQPQQQLQSPIRMIQESEITRLEQKLNQRKKNVQMLQQRLVLLKRIRIRHRLLQMLKANLV